MTNGYLMGFRGFPLNVLLRVSCIQESTSRRETNLNLELILLQIFSDLYPQDLLNLDRTCLELHKVLLDHRCWERTFQNVGLPPCPPDLSPHQYATLVFNPLCQVGTSFPTTTATTDLPQFCYRSRGTKVYWLCRVRCCNKCLYIKYIPTQLMCSGFIHILQFQVTRCMQFSRLLRLLCPVCSRRERLARPLNDSPPLTGHSRASISPRGYRTVRDSALAIHGGYRW